MYKSLYIIGNGFDLHHKLGTSYDNYRDFIKENNKDTYDMFCNYFEMDKCDDGNDENTWRYFEHNLSTFSHIDFFYDRDHIDIRSDNFKYSELYSLYDDVVSNIDYFINNIKDSFFTWIYEKEVEDIKPILQFEKNSFFLTFNYTNILEQTYKINSDNIWHIHGDIQSGELIFGHGEIIPEGQPDFDEHGEVARTMYSDAENASLGLLYDFKKDVDGIIKKHETIFNQLESLESIYILGHSLSDIDMPYLKHIFELSPDATFYVSYYGDNNEEIEKDKIFKIQQLQKIGINRFEFIKLEE